jgi:hypothetical protein
MARFELQNKKAASGALAAFFDRAGISRRHSGSRGSGMT